MQEQWKPVPGYKGWYEVSSLGRVRRIKPNRGATVGRVLRPNLDKHGYKYVVLSKRGIHKKNYIHIMICETFHGTRPQGNWVNHKDGNPLNNRMDNLEWTTPSENNLHKCRVLKKCVGADHPWYGICGPKHPRSKKFIMTSPTGQEIAITGICEFCRQNGLQSANIYKVMAGQINHHRGWRCRRS